jgi:subtilisin family serine protease
MSICARRVRWSLRLAVLVPAALLAGPDRAADPLARFQRLPDAGTIRPAVTPLVVDGGPRVEVMVRLAGPSVAERRAQAPGQKLGRQQRLEVESALESDHAAAEMRVDSAGGRVLRHMYHAWNGMRVSIARDRVPLLSSLPGVTAVLPVRVHRIENARSVPFIGAPGAWAGVPSLTGRGVKVAVIDTGIDYTHANFAGPGTVAAYQAAAAASTSAADPALFGPSAPKVKGGTDLVGDAYDASSTDPARTVPHPDDNPLDCNGHGSHVAGTIAGLGVKADGATYAGPFDASTYSTDFRVGPGVAPQADLYAVRVFGCEGSTDLVTEAIDWAVKNDMDVINMSLGSPFGDDGTSDAQAADAAARAGVVVVASAGNSGPEPYLSGTPGAASGALAVAAMSSWLQFPGAVLTLDGGTTLTAIDANGLSLPAGPLGVVVLHTAAGGVSLGCNEAEYVDATIAGKVVVTRRGTCARVDRATFGARHGAAAVVMINNAAGLPPYEGPIPGVTIPFLGVSATDAAATAAATSVAMAPATIPNPGARAVADFSSGGPRFSDSALKPDLAAPGVAIFSTAVGTGNGGVFYDGTSMASPHVAGVAALTVQAHAGWGTDELRAAIENTADPAKLATAELRLVGAGLVQPALSTRTQVVAFSSDGDRGERRAALDFGFVQLLKDFRAVRTLVVKNLGSSPATFEVSSAAAGGVPHATAVNRGWLRLGPGESRELAVSLTIPAATAGDSTALRDASGFVTLTPISAKENGGIALRVPYHAVVAARALIEAAFQRPLTPGRPQSKLLVKNSSRAVAGTADFYEWGLWSPDDGLGATDLQAAGVQTWDLGGDHLVVFALSTYGRWSSAAPHEFDVLVDLDGDGAPDKAVIAIDHGLVTAGSHDGLVASLVLDLATGDGVIRFLAVAPTNGDTLLLPALASDLGLSANRSRFQYTAQSFDGLTGASDAFEDLATFNAWTPVLSQPDFQVLDPGASLALPYQVNVPEVSLSRPKGLMVVKQENWSALDQAQLISLPLASALNARSP